MTGEMSWHSLRALPVALAGVLAIIAFVLWFYPAQLRFIARPWRWILPALRILALVALAISVLKPVVIRARPAEQRDAVVVLIDRSRSMGVRDSSSRTPAELVALADGLGLLPDGARRDPVAGFDRAASDVRASAEWLSEARGALEVARVTGDDGFDEALAAADRAALRFRSSVSSLLLRAQALPKDNPVATAAAELNRISPELPASAWIGELRSRMDRIESALRDVRAAADAELYAANADVKRVCDEVAQRTRLELVASSLADTSHGILRKLEGSPPVYAFAFDGGDAAALPLSLDAASLASQPEGLSSDIDGALRSAADQLRGRGVQAILLLTDGKQVGPAASQRPVVEAPVFAIGVAPRQAGKDVAVARVIMPMRQFIGETMLVRVDVRHRGYAGAAVDVSLSAGDAVQQSQRITLPDDPVASVEFPVKLDAPPAQKVVVSVSALPDEATQENNQVHRWVKVVSEKLDVVAYSGSPAWDFQYLRNTLSRTPWVLLEEAILPNETIKPTITPEQIFEKDVIVLHDLAAASLSGEQWTAIHRFVTERGGSLLLIAGDAHLPAEYGQNETLASFLPYRGGLKPVWRTWPGQTPSFQLVPAPGTEAIDALRLSDDPAEGRQRWNVLPGWFRYLSIAELKSNATPLLIERDSKAPVLTEARLGLGRVFFFGGNETWRWRYRMGEALQDRFWLQLIRYAAGEPYTVTSGGASLDLEPLAIEPGKSVRVRARVKDAAGMPSKLPQQTLHVLRGSETVREQALSAVGESGSGRYEAMISNLPAGTYQVRLASPDAPAEAPVQLDLHVAGDPEAEMADVAGDEQNLRRIAQATGGEFLPLERIGELPELIAQRHTPKTIVAEYPLWDSPYLFVFVVACFGAEWALRKAVGLA